MSARRSLADGACIALALAGAYAVKSFYSRATFDDLIWILEPTRRLVELLTGTAFELEAHRAFLSRDLLFEIVPSCAGVNFMIAVFCSLVCGLVYRQRSVPLKAGWLLVSGAAAYVLTIVANATRIAIGIGLHLTRPSVGCLTPERLHRIEGIAVYFLFLCLAYGAAVLWIGGPREPASA